MTIKTIIITANLICKSFNVGQSIHLELTLPETNSILKALHTAPMPYDESAPLIDKVTQQALPQLQNDSSLKK